MNHEQAEREVVRVHGIHAELVARLAHAIPEDGAKQVLPGLFFHRYSTPRNGAQVRAIGVSLLDASLLDAVVRLVRLVDSPDDARILAPLITREIIYRLLRGTQSERLRHLAVPGGQLQRIIPVIERI